MAKGTKRKPKPKAKATMPSTKRKKKPSKKEFQYDSNECTIPNKSSVVAITISPSATTFNVQQCPKLTSVILPPNLTSIQPQAFECCESLPSLTLPDTVSNIGEDAFRYCYELQSINLPEGIKIIEDYVFGDCKALTSITLPPSLTELKKYCFTVCANLTAITIPPSVTKIGEGVFSHCTKLGECKFESNNTLTHIGDYAFYNCEGLFKIDIPTSVQYIGKSAFHQNIFLKSIVIPSGVSCIQEGTFHTCSNLSLVDLPSSITEIHACAFQKCRSLVSLSIPPNVTKIGASAFKECYFLQLMVLPKSVEIENSNSLLTQCTEFRTWKEDGHQNDDIVEFLKTRFDTLPMHKACYYLNATNDGLNQLQNMMDNDKPSLSMKDGMGMTPLHVLCCNPKATPEMIKLLMSGYPEAATVRNTSKMSPLDMFMISKGAISSYNYEEIRNGYYDDENNDGYDSYCNNEVFDVKYIVAASWRKKPKCNVLNMFKTGLSGDVLEVIFALYDEMKLDTQLVKKDGTTGMYPFMTAAASPKCGLDVVYMVAMSSPDLLVKK